MCRTEAGHSNFFRCPYHNWSYANDGRLVGVAQSDGYPDDLDKSKLGLRRANRIGSYRGLVFASLSDDGPTFEEYISPVKPHVDAWFDRSPTGQIELLTIGRKRRCLGSWTRFAAQPWDIPGIHQASRDYAPAQPGLPPDTLVQRLAHGHIVVEPPEGRRSERNLGDTGQGHILIYPNLWLGDSYLGMLAPRAVDRTDVTFFAYALGGTPDASNQRRSVAAATSSPPAGTDVPRDTSASGCTAHESS